MRRLLPAVAAFGFVVAAAVTGIGAVTAPPGAAAAPDTAAAAPHPPPAARAVWSPGRAAQPGQQAQPLLRMEIDQLNPRVVGADGPDHVHISGKLTNVGDRTVHDLILRLERGKPLASEDDLRAALREPANAELVQPAFTRIGDSLAQGQSLDFALDVPLRGSTSNSLAIDGPGVYPLLANVNGTPDYGGPARLVTLSTLLPVLAVPGGDARAKPANPAKVTVLWPLVDRPRLVKPGPDGQAVLSDDDLAGSLAVGGRLDNLLQAYAARANDRAVSSLCLAVDPDLLASVLAMSKGYQVAGGAPGAGRDAATSWLRDLRRAAEGHCVLALPYADADLVALTRGGLTDLAKTALSAGASTVAAALKPAQVQPLSGVAWPYDGVVDQPTLGMLADAGVSSVLLRPQGLASAPGSGPLRLDRGGGASSTAVRVDGLLSDALTTPPAQPAAVGKARPADSRSVSVQGGLAALVFRTGFQDLAGQNLVIAPPRGWDAPASELKLFLDTVQSLYDGSYATPAPLEQLVTGPPPEPAGTLSYPPTAGAQELSRAVVRDVGTDRATVAGLADAMQQDDSKSPTPASLTDPLRLALLRATSGQWRGDEDGARSALAAAEEQITGLRGNVTVVQPGSSFSISSGSSRVPVVISNQLPVLVRVQVVVDSTPGITQELTDVQLVPANGSRTVYVSVQVQRSGRLSITAHLTTPDQVPLGESARLELSSSAYGTITLVITATAAGALVLLSGRRIYRRIRGRRASDRTLPGEPSPQQDEQQEHPGPGAPGQPAAEPDDHTAANRAANPAPDPAEIREEQPHRS